MEWSHSAKDAVRQDRILRNGLIAGQMVVPDKHS
jgi:hypothetical protein